MREPMVRKGLTEGLCPAMECCRTLDRIVGSFSSPSWVCSSESGFKECVHFLEFPQRLGMSNWEHCSSGNVLEN